METPLWDPIVSLPSLKTNRRLMTDMHQTLRTWCPAPAVAVALPTLQCKLQRFLCNPMTCLKHDRGDNLVFARNVWAGLTIVVNKSQISASPRLK